jgi:hypothetical protein
MSMGGYERVEMGGTTMVRKWLPKIRGNVICRETGRGVM